MAQEESEEPMSKLEGLMEEIRGYPGIAEARDLNEVTFHLETISKDLSGLVREIRDELSMVESYVKKLDKYKGRARRWPTPAVRQLSKVMDIYAGVYRGLFHARPKLVEALKVLGKESKK
jgi:hypothetical protein